MNKQLEFGTGIGIDIGIDIGIGMDRGIDTGIGTDIGKGTDRDMGTDTHKLAQALDIGIRIHTRMGMDNSRCKADLLADRNQTIR